MNVVDNVSGLLLATYEKTSDARAVIKKGVLVIGKEVGYVAHDIYSMDGFEKWTKALIADLELLSCIPAVNGIFDECLKTLKGQKDLYYATMIFNSLRHLVGKEEIKDADDNVIGTRRCFQLPRRDDDKPNSGYDWHKFAGLFANVFELGKFLQKQRVLPFEKCSALANRFGAWDILGPRFDEIPFIRSFLDSPKDPFVIIMSGLDLQRCYSEPGDFWIKVCKVVGSIGKIGLIGLAPYWADHSDARLRVAFKVLNVVTQNASLFGHMIKAYKGRQDRFEHPPSATAAA